MTPPPASNPPPADNPPPVGNPPPPSTPVFTGGEIDVDTSESVELPGSYGGPIDLIKGGEGSLILTGNSTYTGGTTIKQGTLQLGNGGITGSIKGDVQNDGQFAFYRSDDVTFDGLISGTGVLNQHGGGRLTITAANTYTGGTSVGGGTLEVAPGAALGTGDVTVGLYVAPALSATLQVDRGAALPNTVWLAGHGVLDNTGLVGGDVPLAVRSVNILPGSAPVVLNHDGGMIKGAGYSIQIYDADALVRNSSGGTIDGVQFGMLLGYGGRVENDGVGSLIRSDTAAAITTQAIGTSIRNTDGATITGWLGLDLQAGGGVTNAGVGSSISGIYSGIMAAGGSASVSNTGGARISSAGTTISLERGGSVVNGSGSLIETRGTATGPCITVGVCAISAGSYLDTFGNVRGGLVLSNAGTIVGNIQVAHDAGADVTLFAGSSIRGDLDIGSGRLTFDGASGQAQLYSQAVTGRTTFTGGLTVRGGSQWNIDNDDLQLNSVTITDGTLQVGNGGTTGSIGPGANVDIYHGNLVFNRSDDLTFDGSISSGHSEAYDGTLVQAGTGTLTLVLGDNDLSPTHVRIDRGTLQIDNTGAMPGSEISSYPFATDIVNNGSLVFDSSLNIFTGSISGSGSVTQNGSAALIMDGRSTYTGGLMIHSGSVMTSDVLPGDVTVSQAAVLSGGGRAPQPGLPGVGGNLANAGRVVLAGGDAVIGGNYNQLSSGTLAVKLGSKLAVNGTATLGGGVLEITGAEAGYTSNTHTDVLTATGGLNGTFDRLVKDTGVVFTATTITYDAHGAWLDTTGLDVTTAAAGNGVTYTPASFRSAQRVQGAFTQLDDHAAAGSASGVSSDFVRAAGQFQQAPTLEAAQASLQSLSGQLHAASAAMTFEAIDASTRAMSDHLDDLLGKNSGVGVWTQNLNVGGDMGRAGYDGVGFQLNGWLVGSDRQIGNAGVAGFAFGQSQGRQQLDRSYDHNRSRNTEGMFYAAGLQGNWYTQGRVGFGQFRQDVSRQLLLGVSQQGVATRFGGNYRVAYGESGLHLDWAGSRLMPNINVEYASIDRGGFAEQGAGGFGLRSNAQSVTRWQAGLGMRAAHHWAIDGGRAVDLNAGVQFRRTVASKGEVFDASFVGLQEWQPLGGIGLSRYSGVLNIGLDATLSARTTVKLGYDYQKGQRDQAQALSAHLVMAF
ncbi:autotransporter domain-containing protein [Luteibacter aegosomatissinici]|uniref:autotransporter domain-containing protein n=1 Tax=Luteibacter aegosomatissinici TaxID=2911539 RepID=UPI001FFAEB0D|nr:autotransporter domain-containing protein [Luteibacter aegosomatissinici]UPG96598.1 autotransporter domain-containing protein [Luteibacter aegosomatissinici]